MRTPGVFYCGIPFNKSLLALIMVISLSTLPGSGCSTTFNRLTGLPQELDDFIEHIEYANLGPYQAEINYDVLSDSLIKVTLSWIIEDTLCQDDWQVSILPKFKPTFHWSPHLTPTEQHIISQHVFRAPAVIMSSKRKQITVIPDLDILKNGSPVPWYMDLDAVHEKILLGLSNYSVKEHVLFTRKPDATFPPGNLEFGFYIMTTHREMGISNPWRNVLSFLWDTWGSQLYNSNQPLGRKNLESYADHTYNWAFKNWRNSVWQEFDLNQKRVGAPSHIVNVTQSPNYPGIINERAFRSIWNQAWFSSLRSAQGLFRYARRTENKELMNYALKTKELTLAFPKIEGFFYGLVATEMEQIKIEDQLYNRSKGWKTYFFGNSDRNPYFLDPPKAPFHILDMSFTAYLMLTWYDELEKDERLLDYALEYADALLNIQRKDGFFPAWLSVKSLEPLDYLNRSPETSMSVTFLLKLYELTNEKRYLNSALRAMEAVTDNIINEGRWEDFETYWSCCRYGTPDLINKKVERNDMYKQNNFSMYWTAEALFNCYQTTRESRYLEYGQRTLDELLMTQAIWQPPYMYVNTFGGFGVMNADGEWNDSRQSLFSELIVQYGQELENMEYIQRGLSALRASFVMMYCPENPLTKIQYEKKYNFFGPEDFGFMMENYGHSGSTNHDGIGIGTFTIYDWGNGAASEAYNRMLDHYGKNFLEDY